MFTKLDENDIKLIKVPANFTYLYQPLDSQASVNVASKQFMKTWFTKWSQVIQQIDMGKDIASIDVKFQLTTLKPLHAKWLIELHNYLTSPEGREICMEGWKVTGIYDAIQMTSKNLPSLDPFADIDPLFEEEDECVYAESTNLGSSQIYVTGYESDGDFELGDDTEEDERLFEDEGDEDEEDCEEDEEDTSSQI